MRFFFLFFSFFHRDQVKFRCYFFSTTWIDLKIHRRIDDIVVNRSNKFRTDQGSTCKNAWKTSSKLKYPSWLEWRPKVSDNNWCLSKFIFGFIFIGLFVKYYGECVQESCPNYACIKSYCYQNIMRFFFLFSSDKTTIPYAFLAITKK